MVIIAINSKHQAMVNKATNWLNKYDIANDLRSLTSDTSELEYDDDCPRWRKQNRACEKAFDKYLEYYDELPKREQQNIDKNWKY